MGSKIRNHQFGASSAFKVLYLHIWIAGVGGEIKNAKYILCKPYVGVMTACRCHDCWMLKKEPKLSTKSGSKAQTRIFLAQIGI